MKAICDRKKLLRAFRLASLATARRSPKPILENIKLEVDAKSATVVATNLETSIRLDVPGFEVELPGSVVLPADRFGAILAKGTSERLALDCNGSKLAVAGEASKYSLPVESPDLFPASGRFAEEQFCTLPAGTFCEAVRRTVFATDEGATRYAVSGVLFEQGEDRLHVVATNGRCIAVQAVPVESAGSTEKRFGVVLAETLKIAARVLADCEGDIRLAFADNSAWIAAGAVEICGRLVEGRFPRWREHIPDGAGATKITLPVGRLLAAIEQAAITTSEQHMGVHLAFGSSKLMLHNEGAERGESRVEMPVDYDGPELAVTLNPFYLADFLRVLDSSTEVTAQVVSAETVVALTTNDNYTFAIAPMCKDKKNG